MTPGSVSILILHIGTNYIASCGAVIAIKLYKRLLNQILREQPPITSVYITLVLPRDCNPRRKGFDSDIVRFFNYEASLFNRLLRELSQDLPGIFFYRSRLGLLAT